MSGEFIDEYRQDIIGQMIHKIRHRDQPLPAGREAGRAVYRIHQALNPEYTQHEGRLRG